MNCRLCLTLLILCFGIRTAHATMPLLTETPKSKSEASCREWAANQSEDALEMWGIQEDGSSLRSSAISRLSDSCLGYEKPEIVGFGSSAGYDEAYCERHPNFRICKKANERAVGEKRDLCVVNDPTPTPLNYRTAPYGKILGTLDNGQGVKVLDASRDVSGKFWVYVANKEGVPLGWVFRQYVLCSR